MLAVNSRPALIGARTTSQSWHKLPRRPWKCVQCAAGITFVREGDSVTIDQDVITVGSSRRADLRVDSASVAAEHARLERRAARVYLLALLGDEEDLHSASGTCLEGTQLRRGVAYLLAPGANVRFGDTDWVLDFEEQQGSTAAAEALFEGMLAGASDEVKNALKD